LGVFRCIDFALPGFKILQRRYQGVNSEILHHYPSNNGKKTVVKICSKDINVENGSSRHLNRGSLEIKGTVSMAGLRIKGASSSMRSPDNVGIVKEQEHDNRNGDVSAVPGPSEQPVEGNQPTKDPREGGDVLFQWCKKKRPRGHRTESRSLMEDSSIQGRKSKQAKRQATKSEKQRVLVQSHVTVHSRSTTLRHCTPLREPSHGFIKRNSEDLNGALLNNGLQQKVDRHSPSPVEKHAKSVGCFSPNAIGTTRVSDAVRNSTPSDTDACAPPEKIDMETFEWPRFLVSLSRKEKEDDFLIMKGTKLSQRPKKRPKYIEKVLQNCFPGSWLSDVAKGRYEVREKKCTKKKPRGLKAMESSDSDSD